MSPPSQQQLADQIVADFKAARYEQAFVAATAFSKRFPTHSFGWKALGGLLKLQGRLEEALRATRTAVEINERDADSQQNLGVIYKELGQFSEAERHLRLAYALKPTPMLLSSIGTLQMELGRLHESEVTHRKALSLAPNDAMIALNLASTLSYLGQVDQAIAMYQHATRLNPNAWLAWDGLLLAATYTSTMTSLEQRALSDAYATHIARVTQAHGFTSWPQTMPHGRLRVGLVSADFRDHPVGYFLQTVLKELDATQLSIFLYSNRYESPASSDTASALRQSAEQWRNVHAMSDAALAQQIRDDGIHVLVDLSGHTLGNRLPMFALKPAPVSVSWLGYFATTAVPAIDYVLVDEISVQKEHSAQFSERVWRLPRTRLCFSPPGHAVAVNPLPAQARGYCTLGCFQNYAKITNAVLAVWSACLTRIPNARLRVQSPAFADEAVSALFRERLVKHAIDPQRVTLVAATNRLDYLRAHHEIDFILDTFPFPGGTTTCEALWMGVPTLTLAGDSLISRQGVSLLTAAGLDNWIAPSVESYVEKAVAFASDVDALALLRSSLREMVMASPLFDAHSFARDLETALWGMWRETGEARIRG